MPRIVLQLGPSEAASKQPEDGRFRMHFSHGQNRATQENALFYHDLQCLSGFGDRLLDLWAVRAITRLHTPKSHVMVRWSQGMNREDFSRAYSTDLFLIEGSSFTDEWPQETVEVNKGWNAKALNDRCIYPLEANSCQLLLRQGRQPGSTSPDSIFEELSHYGLSPALDRSRVIETYQDVAKATLPVPMLERDIPNDVSQRVGIHVRLSDKLVESETPITMSKEIWQTIEQHAMDHIQELIGGNVPLLICSDDTSYKEKLLRTVSELGGSALSPQYSPSGTDFLGYDTLVDFFALSRCRSIVQMTKYSTFSIAAAIAGGIPLLNFDRDENGVGNKIELWRGALND